MLSRWMLVMPSASVLYLGTVFALASPSGLCVLDSLLRQDLKKYAYESMC